MPRHLDHGAYETIHLTEPTFDEALLAAEGLVIITARAA